MDANEFRKRGKEMVEFIVNYFETVSEREVSPNVKPGFLFPLLPSTAPNKGDSYEKIMKDFDECIMPGILHWQHPRFHSYFPGNSSYPSILGETISNTIGCPPNIWNISRSEKEINSIVMNWYGKMIGLPEEFLYDDTPSTKTALHKHTDGGGLFKNTCSDCIFLSLIAARNVMFKKIHEENTTVDPISLLPSLVAYCTTESHSAIEKAAMVAMVNIKVLEADENFTLRGETFAKEVENDIKNGLIPFFASITLGSTSCCACDPIDEIGPVCEKNGIWLNVDAAYGGNAVILQEYKHLLKGIGYASTFVVNPVKMMMINFDGAVIFTKYLSKLENSFSFENDLFHYGFQENCYQPNERFRALKLWFVIRNYGVERLQGIIRNYFQLAEVFKKYVKNDERFELLFSNFALVCFRLKGSNLLNKKLLMQINESAKLHITACSLQGKYVLRFCVCYLFGTEEDMTYAWSVFCDFAEKLLESENR